MKRNENLKKSYIEARKFFSDYGYVIGTKNKMFDFMVLGVKKDFYVKIVKNSEIDIVDFYVKKMKEFGSKRRLTAKVYVLYFLDEKNNISDKECLNIN